MLRAATWVQAGVRGMLARADARRKRRLRAAIIIQSCARMHHHRSRFLGQRAAVLTIQSAYRGRVARTQAMEIRWPPQLPHAQCWCPWQMHGGPAHWAQAARIVCCTLVTHAGLAVGAVPWSSLALSRLGCEGVHHQHPRPGNLQACLVVAAACGCAACGCTASGFQAIS